MARPDQKMNAKEKEDKRLNGRAPAPFQVMWSEYVHRVKVHELLRCLEVEQKKLRVLRDHLNIKDLADEPEGSQGKRERKIVFQHQLQEETAQAEEIAQDVRKSKSEPDYLSKSVIRLFDNNQTITDEQFEKILELCKDEQERKRLEEAYVEKRNREKYLSNASEDRRMLYNFLNSEPMQMFMLVVIFISTLVLFLLSFEGMDVFYSYGLTIADSIIMSVFIVEAGLKIYIYKDDYFRSPANCLDLTIIITHFVEILVNLGTQTLAVSTDISASLWFKLLKSLRSLRVLRAIKFLPSLQVIITTIIQSLISISSIAALMLLFMFVFAVAGRELFREGDEKRFGNFAKTSLTLFQLLTLDDWGDILEDNNYEFKMFIYLFLYIVCEYFVFLNLFVAVLVDNFQLSIEAAQTVVDENEEKQKWADRLDELMENAQDSGTSLHSRHKDAVRELGIEEYFRLQKDSEEAKLLATNLKKLTAIDFQYHMWNRRMRLTSAVLEAAATDRSLRIGHANVEIPGVDTIETQHPNHEDLPLKPSRVAKKKAGIATDSNFQLKAKKAEKKKKDVGKKNALGTEKTKSGHQHQTQTEPGPRKNKVAPK